MPDETSPLLGDLFDEEPDREVPRNNLHAQFCKLIGIPSSAGTGKQLKRNDNGSQLLYERAKSRRRKQELTYILTASFSNILLLSQVILGAALTGLGASESSHILITVFGALNTVIAGLVAYLKSRGQPMRARMFRDDLDRVVDEIENSEIMWLGISRSVHGYDEIDVENEVSVRSEVARLTRLYDRAVRNSTMNNPDMYMAGGNVDPTTGLRARPGPQMVLPAIIPAPAADPQAQASSAPAATVAADPDESPATAKPKPEPTSAPNADSTAPVIAPVPGSAGDTVTSDPDKSPATAKPQSDQLTASS
ncbi:hypothetical protein FH972_022273 [Carpinus fangiana]|uniref:SMODS and SLOG-associating 2TM effector domain-containing protein n=1 Tax=Carpinus fangiana TaxID=176857 RepID=A0A5N6KS41_9ROSI|nr:hypothetical protein FH972_022273 [Carpinus fangiana]